MEKHVLVIKMFTNWLNMGLPLWAWVEKTVDGIETDFFGKEKVLGAATVSQEVHVDSLLLHKRTLHYWFPWKSATVNPVYWMALIYCLIYMLIM